MARSIVSSKHVYLDIDHPDVPADIVIEGDRVREVVPRGTGDRAAANSYHDYGDAFVSPGFHDAHQHVLHTALFPSSLADRYPGKSESDCVERLRSFALGHPGDGWLISQGWRSALWDPAVPPTRDSLDAAFPARPVAMCSGDLHTLWLNTAGLRALGISEDAVPPAGGIFDRDANGRLTGVLREAAGMVYTARVFSQIPREELLSIYGDYFQRMLAQGVTSVCDMALSAVPGADNVREDVYEGLLADGRLPMRVNMFPQLVGDFDRIQSLQARLTGPILRAPGMKQFFDGVSSAHTAWLTEPYANPYFPGDCGRPTVDPERMRELVLGAASRGIAVRIHTIGDRAIHTAIDIFREAYERYGAPRQGANSLEHLENLLPGDVEALRDAHLVASVQPQHIVIDVTQPDRDLGPERASLMWPFASYRKAGVTMAFGTDSPCVDPLSMEVLGCAVTREDPRTGEPRGGWLPSERIPMNVAIDAYTRGSAVVAGRADELGTIAPGMLADLAVFDHNLMSTPAERLGDVRVVATYVGGALAWER